MPILEEDEEFLTEKSYKWRIDTDQVHGHCLVISDFVINVDKYNIDKTDLLILIPPQYNNSTLDMYYVNPEVKLKDGQYPSAADQFIDCLGRRWQRFSRHITNWNPGVDSLRSFMTLIKKELQ